MTEHEISFQAGAHAFGDGSHPTTAGILTALEAIDPALFTPRIACDIGCGSGILAFSIIKLFRCFTIATDISTQAIETVLQNARENGIEISGYTQNPLPETVQKPALLALQSDGFSHPALAAHAPYDLITMNILACPLMRLAADAERHLAPGGVLIVSGILHWQEPPLREAYQSLTLELTSRLTAGDWVTLVWQKPGEG